MKGTPISSRKSLHAPPLATSLENGDRLSERGAGPAMRSVPRTAFERTMDKPRIFLGSSGKQEKLLQALTRGLEGIAHVDPWTTSFQPGTTTLERLVELTHQVDFAAFAFARDDWTTTSPTASPRTGSRQASPRDNVVFEAGLFGGVLGMRRTFIIHANGAKLPSDLLGLTSVRYDEAMTPFRHQSDQPEAPAGDRERGAHVPDRRLLVAVLSDGTRPTGTFRRKPLADLAKPQWCAGGRRPLVARGWQSVGEIPVRSGEGEEGPCGRFLLLEGRTALELQRPTAGRDWRDPDGYPRSRGGVLDDAFGDRPDTEYADFRCLPPRRPKGHEHPGRTRRPATRGTDR